MGKFLIAFAILFLLLGGESKAQNSLVVQTCGTLPLAYKPGATRNDTVDVNGNKCISGSISASTTGFTPANTGTPIAVTTAGVTGTLPSGSVVVAFNVGTTNTAFCKLGASSTVNDIAIPPQSWFAYTVGASTQLTCITSTGTTTVNMIGGTGLPTGAGGGAGGSGGGAVFGPTAVGSAAANPPIMIGGTANAASNGTVQIAKVDASGTQYFDTQTTGNLITVLNAPTPAGTNFIGGVVADTIVNPSANFTRPANTTAYAAGQLVANSTTAGSVTPMSFTAARISGGNFYVRRFRMTLSSKSITNTSFRLHLFTVTPATITNGDGGTFNVTEANEFCTLDTVVSATGIINWEAGADVSIGYGTPSQGNECNGIAAVTTIFGLLEARAAYTPASGETITTVLEIHQN